EEGLHRRVVPGNADFPHRSDEVMPVQRVHELPRPELGGFNWWTQHLRSRRVLMGRPAGWLKELTGRSAMISPGAPKTRRSIERRFWKEIAMGRSSEEAAGKVGVSAAV